jgi:hypothetical protein
MSDVFDAGSNHQGEFMEKLEKPEGDIHSGYKYPDFYEYYSSNFES